MEHENDKPNISSDESMKKDINEMVNIECDKAEHGEILNKICVDEECDEENE